MYVQKSAAVLIAGLTMLAMGGQPNTAVGEEPQPVLREFFLKGIAGQTFADLPDFEAESSELLMTTQFFPVSTINLNYIQFGMPDGGDFSYVEEFSGTQWYFYADVIHVTADGAEKYHMYWKDELPPNGTMVWTGPQGDVIQGYGWVRNANASDDGINSSLFVLVSEFDESDPYGDEYVPIVYGAGLFSR